MQTKPKMVSRDPAPGGPRRRRQRDPQPALGYLKGSERLAALDRDLAALQPGLPLVALKLDRQVLVVTAGSAAVAARLRQFEPRLILPLSLSADHRVIDGALATRFNVYLAQLLADMRRVLL